MKSLREKILSIFQTLNRARKASSVRSKLIEHAPAHGKVSLSRSSFAHMRLALWDTEIDGHVSCVRITALKYSRSVTS